MNCDQGSNIRLYFVRIALHHEQIQTNWGKIKNLPETLGKNGVTSNYSAQSVQKTDEFIKAFKGGNALFTMPSTPIKCAGAPQKIMYLAEEQWRKAGVRSQTNIKYFTGLGKIFAIDKYAKELLKICKARDLDINYFTDLAEIRPESKEAVFNVLAGEAKGTTLTLPYDFLHVTPPMGPPDFVKSSPLSNADGWVDVDKDTLRHNKFENVYALGDCSSLPTSKTAAAIAAQSAVLKNNLLGDIFGDKQVAKYDGYTSCPVCVHARLFNGFGIQVAVIFQLTAILNTAVTSHSLSLAPTS